MYRILSFVHRAALPPGLTTLVTIRRYPTCLRLVAQVWQSRSTLILRTDKNRFIFYEGALIDSDLNRALMRLLVNDSVLIDSANISTARGNWVQTGRRLLELAAAPVDSVWQQNNHGLAVEVFAGDAALTAFEISEELQDMFTAAESLSAFSDTEVSTIYVLWRLGLVRFNQVQVVVEETEDVQRPRVWIFCGCLKAKKPA